MMFLGMESITKKATALSSDCLFMDLYPFELKLNEQNLSSFLSDSITIFQIRWFTQYINLTHFNTAQNYIKIRYWLIMSEFVKIHYFL